MLKLPCCSLRDKEIEPTHLALQLSHESGSRGEIIGRDSEKWTPTLDIFGCIGPVLLRREGECGQG